MQLLRLRRNWKNKNNTYNVLMVSQILQLYL